MTLAEAKMVRLEELKPPKWLLHGTLDWTAMVAGDRGRAWEVRGVVGLGESFGGM